MHGLSSGDFTLALRGLLGGAAPLSASSVRRHTEDWQRFQEVERDTAIIWHLLPVAEKRLRKLNAPEQCREVFRGIHWAPRDRPGPF